MNSLNQENLIGNFYKKKTLYQKLDIDSFVKKFDTFDWTKIQNDVLGFGFGNFSGMWLKWGLNLNIKFLFPTCFACLWENDCQCWV